MSQWTGAALLLMLAASGAFAGEPDESWTGDLTPITAGEWTRARAAHLLERAGFGGTPEEIAYLAAMSPDEAVRHLVHYESIDASGLPSFEHSGVHDAGLVPFPPSRPAATDLARETGEALGVKVKPAGNRPLQPVVDRFFYWLRASMLETRRVAYWWASRMLSTPRPLEEKMTLYWHGHFATSESKVRDYRKMLLQNETLRRHATGSFRDLLLAVARDPAMLVFLDSSANVKGAPNENFARELMELFTMGEGHYTEHDIREAARAFTGWDSDDLTFVVDAAQHDDGEKSVLGVTGNLDGADVVEAILAHPATARFISAKIYRFFVRDALSPELNDELAAVLRDGDYRLKPLLRTIFLSRDFYGPESVGTRVKGPVELVVSTYRKLGLDEIPGVPDFNEVTAALGQELFFPPTVAGWPQGRSWITPGLLLERGNFAYDVLFPDINFIPHDRYPPDPTIRKVNGKIRQGLDITAATLPEGMEEGSAAMAESNRLADRDEDFNTRYGSFRGWQLATQKVKPIPRATAAIDLSAMVRELGLETPEEAVDAMLARFLSVPVAPEVRAMLVDFLVAELGTGDIARAQTYLEEPLRKLVHLILSQPEYQLG